MSGIAAYFNWKIALYWHTVFFSFAMLQELPILGMLWLIINTFVFILLLRAVYGPADDKHSNRGMAWYFYTLSIFTDFLSLCIFGQHIVNEKDLVFLAVFVLVMAVFILLPKPIFAYFLLKSLQNDGFDYKRGFDMRKSTMVDGGNNYQGFTGLEEQYADQGYNNPSQAEPDVVVVPSQPQQQAQQQPAAVSPASGGPSDGPNDINQSLMDSVGQHDVFSPGQ